MANTFLFTLKQTLDNCISELDQLNPLFCLHPETDFTRECLNLKNVTYKGYRLLSCDGSDSNIYRNSSDEETFIHEGENGYNMIHINALYDLMNHTYADFIVRTKDIDSNGIRSSYDLSNAEVDDYIRTTLTRRHTKLTKGNPDIYTILQPSTDFDYFGEKNLYYDIEFRIVRFMTTDGKYVCVATNLSQP